jgi:acetyl-CoA carboxylase biotin carboxyl carrier protein
MDFKDIKELIGLIDASSITELQIEKENFKVVIKKEQNIVVERTNERQASQPAAVKEIAPDINTVSAEKEDSSIHTIKSPIVGTFYLSPGPDAPPYVNVGSKVKKGAVLCIIEAMKLMNEVTSDVDGEIVEVLAENQDIVEYGRPLFKIRKA